MRTFLKVVAIASSTLTLDAWSCVFPPAVANTPGVWTFCTSTWTSETGIALSVTSDDVIVDLGGQTLTNVSSEAALTTFIYANGRKNVVVRNGTISGFLFGVRLEGNGEFYTVENMQIQTRYMGISIDGRGSVVRNNVISGNGGSRANAAYTMPIAIIAKGTGAVITGNTIADVVRPTWYPGGLAYGIIADAVPGGLIARNTLTNTSRDTGTTAITIKNMESARTTYATVLNNTIVNWDASIAFMAASGKYGGNVVQNSPCPTGGLDLGDNSCP